MPRLVKDVVASPGRSLDQSTRAEMAPRFGHDFANVLVHADAAAAQSARAVGAEAFTYGRHLVFGAGRYAPATDAGRSLLAHELTHVMEQRTTPPTIARSPDEPSNETITPADVAYLETSLRTMMALVPSGVRARILRNDTVALGLARDPDGDLTLVYTVARNRTYPSLRAAADSIGATRWVATPRAAGRGAAGAPGDAEQLMVEAGTANSFRVLGMAVTRTACGDCVEMAAAEPGGGVPVSYVQFTTTSPAARGGTATPARAGAVTPGSATSAPEAELPATRPSIPVSGGGRGMPGGGGLSIRGAVAVEGITALAEGILSIAISNYLREKYADSNVEEARKEIGKALESSRPLLDALVVANGPQIQIAQAEGRRVSIHVIVDTNWADTDIGRVLTKASVARAEIVYEDGPPPKPYSTPAPGGFAGGLFRDYAGVTLRYETIDLELAGTNPQAADRRLRRKLTDARLRASGLKDPAAAFLSLIIADLEIGLPLDDLREYAIERYQEADKKPGAGPVLLELSHWSAMQRLIDGPLENLVTAAKTNGLSLQMLRGIALYRSRQATPNDRYGVVYWAHLVRLIDAK